MTKLSHKYNKGDLVEFNLGHSWSLTNRGIIYEVTVDNTRDPKTGESIIIPTYTIVLNYIFIRGVREDQILKLISSTTSVFIDPSEYGATEST